jgi:ParG
MAKAQGNFKIDHVLWRRFRAACIDHGTSATQVLTHFITQQLRQWADEVHHTPKEERHP